MSNMIATGAFPLPNSRRSVRNSEKASERPDRIQLSETINKWGSTREFATIALFELQLIAPSAREKRNCRVETKLKTEMATKKKG